MSVRLIRQASDTPNITNRDDSRMIRFAYGGIDGVIKGYGNELSYSINGSKFVLSSGCIVLQGWEVMVDSWEIDLSTVVNTQYHTVYLEVNIASELATIKSTYQTGAFPSIDSGNDLTTYPNGTARLPLYTFTVTSGIISSTTKKFILLSYYGEKLDLFNKWQEKITKTTEIAIYDYGTGVSGGFGAKNVNLTPGKIYIFDADDKQTDKSLTFILFYVTEGTAVYSTTADHIFEVEGSIQKPEYQVRLEYISTEKRLNIQYRESGSWFDSNSPYIRFDKLTYREL